MTHNCFQRYNCKTSKESNKMLKGRFLASNAFVKDDVKRPTVSEPNYSVNVSIREYGQLTLTIPPTLLSAVQIVLLDNGELGYPLSDFLDSGNINLEISGQFSRFRKSPTSAVSLAFVVNAIQEAVV